MFRGVLADPIKSSFTASRDHTGDTELRPFMRIILDDMPEDPDPVEPGSQGTVVDADDKQVIVDWDENVGRSLHLIPGVDKFHILDAHNPDEMRRSWENLRNIQSRVGRGLSSRCPRCGQLFDVHRGAVSRRISYCNIMLCDQCGVQESIEDFVFNGAAYRADISVFVPEGLNKTGFEIENTENSEPQVSNDLVSHSSCNTTDDIDTKTGSGNTLSAAEGDKERREKLKIRCLPLSEWYIVKIWTGTFVDETQREVAE